MKEVYKLRKRKPLSDKSSLLNVVPQCKELSVKLRLDAITKTMNTRNRKNTVVNKVIEINKNVKSTRQSSKVTVALEDSSKGKTKTQTLKQQPKKTTKTVKLLPQEPDKKTAQKKLKVVVNKLTNSENKTSQNNDTKPSLRRRPPKVYTEQDSTINDSTDKESGVVPIYKRQLKEEEPKKATTDLYEFTDVSPKPKKPTNPHRSSILFDKETYKILQKIEQKEAKAKKKKVATVKKKPTYGDIVSNIMSNLKEKIVNKNNKEPQKEETKIEHPAAKNSVSILENTPSCTDDLHNSFGFENDELPASTPMKPSIRILSDIQLSKGININNESSIDFNVKRPNANSTMLNSSPWRLNWVNMRHNPHFLSIKPNALPRIDQEPIIDYTLVESFESGCQQTPKKPFESTPKKKEIQQSILDYIDCSVEKENRVLQGSLYDCEAFNSPVKSSKKLKKAEVAVNLYANENSPISSPIKKLKRQCLTDITNNTENDVSYFGFDKSVEVQSQSPVKNQEALPMRFDVSLLKKYPKRKKKVNFPEPESHIKTVENESFLDIPMNENIDNQEVHLFEEPEEMLAKMSPPHEGKSRRKRLNSTDSDISPNEKKRKRQKKTKAEIEQEQWVKEFNKELAEVEEYELEME